MVTREQRDDVDACDWMNEQTTAANEKQQQQQNDSFPVMIAHISTQEAQLTK